MLQDIYAKMMIFDLTLMTNKSFDCDLFELLQSFLYKRVVNTTPSINKQSASDLSPHCFGDSSIITTLIAEELFLDRII